MFCRGEGNITSHLVHIFTMYDVRKYTIVLVSGNVEKHSYDVVRDQLDEHRRSCLQENLHEKTSVQVNHPCCRKYDISYLTAGTHCEKITAAAASGLNFFAPPPKTWNGKRPSTPKQRLLAITDLSNFICYLSTTVHF